MLAETPGAERGPRLVGAPEATAEPELSGQSLSIFECIGAGRFGCGDPGGCALEASRRNQQRAIEKGCRAGDLFSHF